MELLLGNILISIAKVIDLLVSVYTFIVAGAVIISWVRPDPHNPIVRFLVTATEPVFSKVRKIFPFLTMGRMDFAPIAVIIILIVIQNVVASTLMDVGFKMRYGYPVVP